MTEERIPTVIFWQGERVDEMERVKLLEAFNELAAMYTDSQKELQERTTRIFDMFRRQP